MTSNDTTLCVDAFHGYQEIKNETWLAWEKSQSEKYKKYRREWEEIPQKQIIREFPMHLDIEVTANCNLRCTFCARTIRLKERKWRGIKNMPLAMFKKIVDESATNGLYAMNLNNVGEPLLNPDLPEMVRYAKDKGIIDVFFHTNGTMLTEDKARALIEAGLDKLIISFDSPYKEKYEQLRINANYEQVLANIVHIAALKKSMGRVKPLTRINFIKLPGVTEKEIADMIALFKDHVDAIGFLAYVDPALAKDKKKAPEYTADYAAKWMCPQLFNRLNLWENGTILPCCMDYDGELTLGNLKENSLKEIWDSRKLAEIRKLHMAGKFHLIPTCAKCDFATSSN